eukprot:6366353-Pyramimonas_sp.AAC.1
MLRDPFVMKTFYRVQKWHWYGFAAVWGTHRFLFCGPRSYHQGCAARTASKTTSASGANFSR